MFSMNSGGLGRLASALMQGNDNRLEKLIISRVEDAGRDLISSLFRSSVLGIGLQFAQRFGAVAETGGASELARVRQQWLSSVNPVSSQSSRILNGLQQEVNNQSRPRRKAKWRRGGWARSRQEWLDEGWRHDWRSQPRDYRGRWVVGRLPYPLQVTLKVSRRLRRIRRVRNARRREGRAIVRGIVSSWAQDGD